MPFRRDEQGRLLRKDGTLVPPVERLTGPRRTMKRGRVSHLRVDQLLGGEGELRDAYEKLLANPNTLLRELAAFLLERTGQRVNLAAVRRHRDRHTDELRSLREATRMASAFCELARRDGPGAIAEAAHGRFEMLLMQDLFKLKDNPQLAPGEWQRWSRAVSGAVANRRSVEELRGELAERAEAEAEKDVDPGERNRLVVEQMREIMGV